MSYGRVGLRPLGSLSSLLTTRTATQSAQVSMVADSSLPAQSRPVPLRRAAFSSVVRRPGRRLISPHAVSATIGAQAA